MGRVGQVIGQDKVNKARYSTARTFSANPFGFSHGQRTVREASRGTNQPAPSRRPNSTSQRSTKAAIHHLLEQILWLVIGAILIALLNAVEIFASEDREAILRLFTHASSYASGRRVTVQQADGVINGITVGLDHAGFLIVRKDDGTDTLILAGGVRAAGS